MNDWSHCESQLRSWKPRRPSPKVKERLLAAALAEAAPEGVGSVEITAAWRWLAPVFGCLLLALLVVHPGNNQMAYLAATGTNNLLATLMSNAGHAAYLDSHSRQNALGAETFAWTNLKGTTSSRGSFPLLNTNTLLR